MVNVTLTWSKGIDLEDFEIEIPEGMTEEDYALAILNGETDHYDLMDVITDAVVQGGSLMDWTVNGR